MSTSYQVKGGTFFETQCTVLYTELECGPDRHTDTQMRVTTIQNTDRSLTFHVRRYVVIATKPVHQM